MREKLLNSLAKLHTNHPWRMILIVIVMTVIFAGLAEQISVTMRWSDLLPSKDIRTLQFNKILEEFTTATSAIVVVQGEENEIKKFAEAVAPRIRAIVDTTKNSQLDTDIAELKSKLEKENDPAQKTLIEQQIREKKGQINKKLVQRIDYTLDTDFLKNHALLLIKEDDLKNMQEVFTNPNLVELTTNLNNSMEKEYVGKEESISNRQKEDQAVMFLDGIKDLVQLLQQYGSAENIPEDKARQMVDKFLYGEQYILSYDRQALVMNVIPNFSVMDIDEIMVCTRLLQGIVDDELKNFPTISAGLTGMVPLSHDEMYYSEKSLGITSVLAFVAILIMLIFAFRMLVAPVLAGLNLIIGIIWAAGVAFITVGQLNIMTSMFAVILIGLGIDFSIHIISSFTENRAAGKDILFSLQTSFQKTGRGIITGGLTTSIAFLALIISSSRGMKEMGLVTGGGLLAILVSTFLFLPPLLVLREKRLDKKVQKTQRGHKTRDLSFRFMGKLGEKLGNRPVMTLLIGGIITDILIVAAFSITFDHNYMNMEAKGLTSIALQDTILEKFDLAMDYGLVLTDDIEDGRETAKKYREAGTVAMVDDISQYLPSQEEQQTRIPYIREIRQSLSKAEVKSSVSAADFEKLINELKRLEMNVIEIQDMAFIGGQDKVDSKCKEIVGDPAQENPESKITNLIELLTQNRKQSAAQLSLYQKQAAPYFKSSVLNMCNTNLLTFNDLPESIKDRYSNKTRDQFLITVFPKGNIWTNAEFLKRFADDLEQINNKATGMPPVFRALIEIIGSDGRKAVMLTLVLMFFVLWYDFGKPGYAILAMIPLAIGVFWMVGLMKLFGLQLTVMNVMGLPLIIGIGIDDGVHIIHRWLSESKSNLYVIFASTGKAILLTSLTTMLGFGSLIFSVWRGFGQLGSAMFIGVAACFLTTVLLLSGLLGYRDRVKADKIIKKS
ncbi:MMPL family transporter [candidate division KSB1 bacterium]|nr:MMPL family transporter [candidate division KSB1 bacterium]